MHRLITFDDQAMYGNHTCMADSQEDEHLFYPAIAYKESGWEVLHQSCERFMHSEWTVHFLGCDAVHIVQASFLRYIGSYPGVGNVGKCSILPEI